MISTSNVRSSNSVLFISGLCYGGQELPQQVTAFTYVSTGNRGLQINVTDRQGVASSDRVPTVVALSSNSTDFGYLGTNDCPREGDVRFPNDARSPEVSQFWHLRSPHSLGLRSICCVTKRHQNKPLSEGLSGL